MNESLSDLELTPEQKILFWSIRVDQTRDDRVRELLTSELNWSKLRQSALSQGVLPILYTRVKALGADSVPPEEMEHLKSIYVANGRRNLRLVRMLLRVIDLFSKHRIQYIPLKGPTLADRLYGNVYLRHFADLDVLIQKEDFSRCYEILMEAGFCPDFPVDRKQQNWLLRSDTEHTFNSAGDILEIHWAIAEKGVQQPLKTDQFLEQLLPVEFYGQPIYELSPENLLLMLCIHGTKHHWANLCWIADLGRFTQVYSHLDWSGILDKATQYGFYKIVCNSLYLSDLMCGVNFPQNVQDRYREAPDIEQFAVETIHSIKCHLNNQIPQTGGDMKYYIRSRERTRDRLYYIFDQAFVPKQVDWLTLSLPKFLYPLYYVFRPLRLGYKFFPRLLSSW